MKTSLLIFLTLILSLTSHGQISIRNDNFENINLRPPIYDSLHNNFDTFSPETLFEYTQYIGQSIFFIPWTEKKQKSTLSILKLYSTNLKAKTIGITPPPFEKNDIGMVYYDMLKNASKRDVKNIQDLYDAKKEEYLKSFEVKTNIYYPKIKNSDEIASGKHKNLEIVNDFEYLAGKTFTIIDVLSGDMKSHTAITSKKTDDQRLLFVLLDEVQDTVYWQTHCQAIKRDNFFIIQGFYDKHKVYYSEDTLVYRDQMPFIYTYRGDRKIQNDYHEIIKSNFVSIKKGKFLDLNTHNEVPINNLSEWNCTDLVLMLNDFDFYELFYILKNNEANEVRIPIGELEKFGFITKSSYLQEQAIRKLKQEEREELIRQQKAEQDAYQAKRKQELIAKYGSTNGLKIYDGDVSLGMTKEMCREAWGEASYIVKTTWGEMWLYGYGNALKFNGNQLSAISVSATL